MSDEPIEDVEGEDTEEETLRDYWNKRHPQKPKKRQKEKFPSTLWYILAIVFGLIGGLISYVATKDEYPDASFSILLLSVISTVMGIVILIMLF